MRIITLVNTYHQTMITVEIPSPDSNGNVIINPQLAEKIHNTLCPSKDLCGDALGQRMSDGKSSPLPAQHQILKLQDWKSEQGSYGYSKEKGYVARVENNYERI